MRKIIWTMSVRRRIMIEAACLIAATAVGTSCGSSKSEVNHAAAAEACHTFNKAQLSTGGLLSSTGVPQLSDPRGQLSQAEAQARASGDSKLYSEVVAAGPVVVGSYDPRLVTTDQIRTAVARFPKLAAICQTFGVTFVVSPSWG